MYLWTSHQFDSCAIWWFNLELLAVSLGRWRLLAVPGHCWWRPCAWCGRGAPRNHCWGEHPGAWSSSHRSACRPAACQLCTHWAAWSPVEGEREKKVSIITGSWMWEFLMLQGWFEELICFSDLSANRHFMWPQLLDFGKQIWSMKLHKKLHFCFYSFVETRRLDTADLCAYSQHL